MPTIEEQRRLYRRVTEYTALPERLLTESERACAQELVALKALTVYLTLLGPVYSPNPVVASRWGHRWSVGSPGTVTDAAGLAALRLHLEARGAQIGTYRYKERTGSAEPAERGGVPLAMTMRVPGTVFGLEPAPVPCLAFGTVSGGGMTRRRARELLVADPLLRDGSHHLIVGTLDPARLKRLADHQGPNGQRAHVVQLSFMDDRDL